MASAVESESDTSVRPLLAENLGKIALGASAETEGSALSKPAFRSDGYFVVGTERQGPGESNFLIFSRADFEGHSLAKQDDGTVAAWQYRVHQHVRDVQWMDSENCVAALDKTLALVHVRTESEKVDFELLAMPDFHQDTIREIAINPTENHLVLSAGFDGRVFITDLLRIMTAMQTKRRVTENILYPCDNVVGSVNWLPGRPNVGSVTTDCGVLHVFDIRAKSKASAVVYDTQKMELYGHSYLDDNTVVLGYGDGAMQVHDLRKGQRGCLLSTSDSFQSAIGDVRSSEDGSVVVVCGQPGVSVWSSAASPVSMQMKSHHRAADVNPVVMPNYKISGDFIAGTGGYFGAADSSGNILVLTTQPTAAGSAAKDSSAATPAAASTGTAAASAAASAGAGTGAGAGTAAAP